MYNLINGNIEILLDSLKEEYVDEYEEIVERLNDVGQQEFQADFLRIWQVGRSLPRGQCRDLFFQRFTELVADPPEGPNGMLDSIPLLADELARNNNRRIPFSACTKLAHMIDNDLPIYDSRIKAFYFWEGPKGTDVDERIRSYMTFYQMLKDEYQRIQDYKLLSPAIAAFRAQFDRNLTPVRKIDFLIWAWVGIVREQGPNDIYT